MRFCSATCMEFVVPGAGIEPARLAAGDLSWSAKGFVGEEVRKSA